MLAGAGIAYLLDFLVHDYVAQGALNLVLDRQATYSNSLHLIWQAARYEPPKLRAFIDHMTSMALLAP